MARHVVCYSYKEFGRYCKAFGEGRAQEAEVQQDELALLAVVGPPGVGKTEEMKQVINNRCLYIEGGKISPIELYCSLYDHRDEAMVVLDDAETILLEPDGRNLAKGICQTKLTKRVTWKTNARELKAKALPQSYELVARMAIISNNVELLKDRKIAPLISRGLLLECRFSADEVHRKTKSWFLNDKSPETRMIYRVVEENLDHIKEPDMRYYYNARVLYRKHVDWLAYLRQAAFGWQPEEVLAAQLMAEKSYEDNERRAIEFKRQTGISRSTFNEILTRRNLRTTQPAPAATETTEEDDEGEGEPEEPADRDEVSGTEEPADGSVGSEAAGQEQANDPTSTDAIVQYRQDNPVEAIPPRDHESDPTDDAPATTPVCRFRPGENRPNATTQLVGSVPVGSNRSKFGAFLHVERQNGNGGWKNERLCVGTYDTKEAAAVAVDTAWTLLGLPGAPPNRHIEPTEDVAKIEVRVRRTLKEGGYLGDDR
jgi:hypothetical protein